MCRRLTGAGRSPARAQEKQERPLALVLPGFDTGRARKARVDGKDFTWWEGREKRGRRTDRAKGIRLSHEKPRLRRRYRIDGRRGRERRSSLGLSIISQAETPGLGDRCVEVANRETLWDHIRGGIPARDFSDEARIPWFQNQFKGLERGRRRSAVMRRGDWNPDMRESLLETNAISALTGATITTDCGGRRHGGGAWPVS